MTELQRARLREYTASLEKVREGLRLLVEQIEATLDASDDEGGEAADALASAADLLDDAIDACEEASACGAE